MKKRSKPLSCFYCNYGTIHPGRSKSVGYSDCSCLDVTVLLRTLHERKVNKVMVCAESWLPYHCGHFSPRMLDIMCTDCGKYCIVPEWKYAFIDINAHVNGKVAVVHCVQCQNKNKGGSK